MKSFFVSLFLIVLGLSPLQAQHVAIDTEFHSPHPIRAAWIQQLLLQQDGKLLIGGEISEVEEKPVHDLARLNKDGSLDESFSFELEGYKVRDVAIQSNGDIIVLGHAYNPETDWYEDEYVLLKLAPDGATKASVSGNFPPGFITVLPNDQVLMGGGVYEANEQVGYLLRFSQELEVDSEFNEQVSFNGFLYDAQTYNDQLYISGNFSLVNEVEKNDIVRLNMDGSLDPSFDTGSGTSDHIRSITIQADGKILLGNTYVNSFNDSGYLGGIARLNNDGSMDRDFYPPRLNGPTSEVFIEEGKIYFTAFTYLNSASEDRLIRLNSDGSLDTQFNPVVLNWPSYGESEIAFDAEGLIINYASKEENEWGLSRFDRSGGIIAGYQPKVGRPGTLNTIDLSGQEVYVGGDFLEIDGHSTSGLARLNPDGTVDPSFTFSERKGAVSQLKILDKDNILVCSVDDFVKVDGRGELRSDFHFEPFKDMYYVYEFQLLEDGRILAGGPNNIRILKADGTEDPTFDIGTGISNSATAFGTDLQANKIVYGSSFSSYNETPANRLIRLNLDGSLDPTFDTGTGPDDMVSLVKVLSNDEILLGGFFTSFDGVATRGIAKLDKDGKVIPEFSQNQRNARFPGFIVEWRNKILVGSTSSLNLINQDGANANEVHFEGISFQDLNNLHVVNDDTLFLVGGHRLSGQPENRFISKVFLNRRPVIKAIEAIGDLEASGTLDLSVSQLTIEDADNLSGDNYILNILPGDHYTVDGSSIIPEEGFSGTLQVSITVSDGFTSSEPFVFPVRVGSPVTALKTKLPAQSVTLYPNPVSESIRLRMGEGRTGEFQLVVFNVFGSKVLETAYLNLAQEQETTIDASKLTAGMYMARLKHSSGKTEVIRFYKSR